MVDGNLASNATYASYANASVSTILVPPFDLTPISRGEGGGRDYHLPQTRNLGPKNTTRKEGPFPHQNDTKLTLICD